MILYYPKSKAFGRVAVGLVCFFVMLAGTAQVYGQVAPVWQTSGQQTNSGTGTTYSVPRPTGLQPGDLVVVMLTQQRSSTTADATSFAPLAADGFTLLRAETGTSSEAATVSVYWKIAGLTEPVNYTGAVTQHTTTPNWKAVATRVTGVNPINPIVATAGGANNNTTTSSTSLALPQVTTAVNNSLIVGVVSLRQLVTGAAPPASMTEVFDLDGSGTSDANTNAPHFVAGIQTIATAGATGTRTFTWTGGARNAGILFAINGGPNVTSNQPCWSRISQRYWVPARNSVGGKVQNGDVVTVSCVINVNAGGSAGANTFPGTCNTSGTTTVFGLSYQQPIPANTTYQTGTLRGMTNRDLIYTGGSTDNTSNMTGNFTDAVDAGDDASVRNGVVVFNLGSGATNTAGGSVTNTTVPRQSGFIYQVVYNVAVNATNGSTINLGGGKLYFANTSGGALNVFTLPDLLVQVDENLATNVPTDTANAITAAENGTFGVLKTTKFGDPIGPVVPGFSFVRNTQVFDTEYSLVAQTTSDPRTSPPTTAPASPNLKTSPTNSATDVVFYTGSTATAIQGGWDVISDHTRAVNPVLGNPLFDAAGLAQGKGYMLLVNGSYAPATIFQATSAGLNPDTYYKVSFWIRNICNNCHNASGVSPVPSGDAERSNPGILPNVAFKIDGKIVYTTGQIAYDNPTGAFDNTASRNSWKKREFIYFNTNANATIDLELINFAPGGGGNDFVIDDIEIKRIIPDITYSENCLTVGSNTTLEGTVNSSLIPGSFTWSRWQISDDGGATWTNASPAVNETASPENYNSSLSITNAPANRKYRLVAAATAAGLDSEQFLAGIAVVTVDNCCVTYRPGPISTNVWSRVENWEFFDPASPSPAWLPASALPASGNRVEINRVFSQNIDYTIFNCPLVLNDNGVSQLTIEPRSTLRFNGGIDGNAYFNSRPVIVRSTSFGTGAIGAMLSNSKTLGDDNVTLERYIPRTKRRWNLLTFGVSSSTATIRDAWGGGSRARVANSANRGSAGWALGNYPGKPNNVPWPTPADYVPYDGTIITGHRHVNATAANGQGFDWWPELIIPRGDTFWTNPTTPIVADRLVNTPSSIRPYRPGGVTDFGPERGTSWLSNNSLNTNYNGLGKSIVNATLNEAEEGYLLFTRGDRRVLENWFDSTTLRPTGTLKKLDRTSTINPAPALTVWGNPYPAPVDFEKLRAIGSNASFIENFFYFWDSNLQGKPENNNGAWRIATQVSPGTWIGVPAPISTVTPPADLTGKVQFISSSQAVLLQGATAGTTTITINETAKAEIQQVDVIPFETDPATTLLPGVLFANINTLTGPDEIVMQDGVGIILGMGFKANTQDANDVKKIASFEDGSITMALRRDGVMLGVEAHPADTDEVVFPLEITGLVPGKYGFTLTGNNMEMAGRQVFVRDVYLQQETPVDYKTVALVPFEVTADTLSARAQRFEIVIRQGSVLPVVFTALQAQELNKDILVQWNVAAEENMSHYEVEHSRNGTNFGKAVQVNAQNVSPAAYQWLHVKPGAGTHFYRVRAVNQDGKRLDSRIVKVTIGAGAPSFTVFPTMIGKQAQATLQINGMKAGNYTLQVTDMAGRVISNQVIQLESGAYTQMLQLPASVQQGRYNVRLMGNGSSYLQVIVKD